MVATAIPLALENTTPEQWESEEFTPTEEDLQRLAMFFVEVANNPQRFPVTGRMAARLKVALRQAKGPARPKSRRGRKGFGATRSQGQQKRDRAARRAEAAAYNEAYARYEEDRKEMEEAYAERVARAETLLGKKSLSHSEKVELFTLIGAQPLAEKAQELFLREENPQAFLDAAAEQAAANGLRTPDGHDVGDPNWESQIPGQVSVEEAIAMNHEALD